MAGLLAGSEDEEAGEILEEALWRDGSEFVRQEAVKALATLESVYADEALLEVLFSPERWDPKYTRRMWLSHRPPIYGRTIPLRIISRHNPAPPQVS